MNLKRSYYHIFFSAIVLLYAIQINISIACSNSPQIINFNKHEYRAASQNWSIAFDTCGYAYIGNNTGLLEFDGISWSLYPSPNGSIVRAVAVDSVNKIYTCGYRELGFWQRNKSGILEYTSLTHLVQGHFATNEEFWNIIIHNSQVCFQSFSGLFIYEGGKFHVQKPGGFLNFVSLFNEDIIFATKNRGLYRLSGDAYEPFVTQPFFQGKNIRFVLPGDTGNIILIGTESHGIYQYNFRKNTFTDWAPHLKGIFSRNKINRGIMGPEKHIVLGTILDGILILDSLGNLVHQINVEKGLQSNTLLGISVDPYNNLWLALDKGVDFISFQKNDACKIFTQNDIGAVYTAALQKDILYVGTNQGLYKKRWGASSGQLLLVPGTQEQVWDCKKIGNSLFVGHNSGTFLIEDSIIKKISYNSGGYSIIRNPFNPNLLIQSTYSNLVVYSKVSGSWGYSHTVKGFNNLIRHLAFDHRNNLWASHLYLGIFKIRLTDNYDSVQEIRHFNTHFPPGPSSHNIHVFKVENRIVFTTGCKMYTYNDLNDTLIPYVSLNRGVGSYQSSFRIIPGPNHRYWFINSQGIGCFKIQMDHISKIKEFPNALFDNQLIPNYENIVPIDEEKGLVCLENGYAILNTASQENGNQISQLSLRLRNVEIGEEQFIDVSELDMKKGIEMPYNNNTLTARFSFPLFCNKKVKYTYRIVGLNTAWSKKIEKPIFTINRIPSGKYQLHVRAINAWGNSSQMFSLPFRVRVPWFRSIPAFIIYFILLVLIVIISRYYTIKRVKHHEKQMRLKKERELIQLRNEKLQSEISFKSQQLANSTMGILKKNEFLLSLKEKLKKQKEHLGSRYPDKYYDELMKKIDGHISGQDDWKVFEANFEQAHEKFLINLKSEYPDLTSSDLKLCAYLRINLTSKEIAPLLGITVRGVENHRYRLRKKLNLDGETHLTDFILGL